jgi:hypothetical protein
MSGNLLVAVMIACGVAGYALVSWLFDRGKRQKPRASGDVFVSGAEGSEYWARGILGIDETDGAWQVEMRYRELSEKLEARLKEPIAAEMRMLAEDRLAQLGRARDILNRRMRSGG